MTFAPSWLCASSRHFSKFACSLSILLRQTIAREVVPVEVLPRLHRPGLDAALRAHDDDAPLDDREAGEHLADEILVAGRVEDIDLRSSRSRRTRRRRRSI